MANRLHLVGDDWNGDPVDPYVRFAVALLETGGHPDALLGMGRDDLELLVELYTSPDPMLLEELQVPSAYQTEGVVNVTGTLDLTGVPRKLVRERIISLRKRVKRLKLAVRQHPRLAESLQDMGPGAPPWDTIGTVDVDGRGVVVGIIDDGCAFANRKFLTPKGQAGFESRVLHLWDQSAPPKAGSAWKEPPDFKYGAETTKEEIDKAIKPRVDQATGTIDEEAIYADLEYRAVARDAHGTHVMDIAAGNKTAVSPAGVAPGADIIFVQIPKTAIGNPADSVLSSYLLDGIMYIFSRAGNRPVVVNISYGGYGGPHDGSTLLERGMDELLAKKAGRAIVLSAGNSLDTNCHAADLIESQNSRDLTWVVGIDDPTLNLLEIWYKKEARLELTLTPPRAESLEPVALNGAGSIQREDGLIVGWIFHRASDSGNGDNHILIALRPSVTSASGDKVAPAPWGDWKVHLANVGGLAADFHAWIERDDAGSRSAGEKLQSRFASADSSPRCTLGSLATGELTISVGAYNTATEQVCEDSACGPTRDDRRKPDICAPAAEDASGDGVMSASALNSQLSPMNGTSAAAPHVAGLVALMFQVAKAKGKPLSAKEVLKRLKDASAASDRKLKPNSRWQQDLQQDLLEGCVGSGRVEAKATLKSVK